jgi:hypothetical protein
MYPAEAMDELKTLRTVLYERWVRDGDPRYRLSFIGGSDDHSGRPGNDDKEYCGFAYRGGLTGLAAANLTRNALWSALQRRHTIAATTGVDRLAGLLAAETADQALLMGETGAHDGAVLVRVLADPSTEQIDLVLDGCLYTRIDGTTLEQQITLSPGRHYLYARLVKRRERLSVSWTSPIYLNSAR